MNNHDLKVGYIPMARDFFSEPGDYRRFSRYAEIKGINYELAEFDKIYDVVVVTQKADITLWRNYQNGIVIYDLTDSYLSIPKTNIKALLRGFVKYIAGQHYKLEFDYWKTVQRMCARADVVICTTEEQRNEILPYCTKVPIILDYFDSVVQNEKKEYQLDGAVKLVWEGMPSNLYQLKFIKSTLDRLSKKYNIELHVVTNLEYYKFLGKYLRTSAKKEVNKIFINSVFHEWEKETIFNIVRQCDIAIIPIDSSYSLTRSKPENKILFFWKMGVPVVASNIPSYIRAMNSAGLDYVCKDHYEWYDKIDTLISSSSLRKTTAYTGKKYANSVFSTEKITRKWNDAFNSVGVRF
jgi:glycosyltransferase involved in cell wall biosynthesis